MGELKTCYLLPRAYSISKANKIMKRTGIVVDGFGSWLARRGSRGEDLSSILVVRFAFVWLFFRCFVVVVCLLIVVSLLFAGFASRIIGHCCM